MIGTGAFTDAFRRDAGVQITGRSYPVGAASDRLGVSGCSLYASTRRFAKVAVGDREKDPGIPRLKPALVRLSEECGILNRGG